MQCYRVADGIVVWRSKALARVNSLAISADSSLLVSGSGIAINSHEIWQTQTGERMGTLPGTGLAEFSQDGKMLATEGHSPLHTNGEKDPPLFRLYRLPEMQEITLGPARREGLNAMALAPQSQRLLCAGEEIEMWRLSNPPELLYHIPLQGKQAKNAAFSPDGSRFVMSIEGALTIWNAETGDLLLQLGQDNQDFYGAVKWVGNKLYAVNRGAVTIFDSDIEGLENW
jgi:WD40 repeat protein